MFGIKLRKRIKELEKQLYETTRTKNILAEKWKIEEKLDDSPINIFLLSLTRSQIIKEFLKLKKENIDLEVKISTQKSEIEALKSKLTRKKK